MSALGEGPRAAGIDNSASGAGTDQCGLSMSAIVRRCLP
jgi:hypothetical protein